MSLVLVWMGVLFFAGVRGVRAEEKSSFVTVVNPVRVAPYTENVAGSIKAEYGVVARNGLPATWLVTYDVLASEGSWRVVGEMDGRQEVGVFLEVTSSLAEAARVKYHGTGRWHDATGLFLSGYTQGERRKLIDAIFERFKERTGRYPVSVGSWWTDSYSLGYMRERYGIVACLGLADQFFTDGYQVWGQYWSTPFYPSKWHAGVPATSGAGKLDVVMLQWAPRDPVRGYGDSLYSTQDYRQVGLSVDYFRSLVELYGRKGENEFGQVVVGLEGDLPGEMYEGEFAEQMAVVAKLVKEGRLTAVTMGEFGEWYREQLKGVSPVQWVVSDDLLGGEVKGMWYQSPRYRVGMVYDRRSKELVMRDLRTYHTDLVEPFYEERNGQRDLYVNVSAMVDAKGKLGSEWKFYLGEWSGEEKKGEEVVVRFEKGEMRFKNDGFELIGVEELPEVMKKAGVLTVTEMAGGWSVKPKEGWLVGREGEVFRDFSLKVPFALRSRAKGVGNNVAVGLVGLMVSVGMLVGFILGGKKVGLILGLMMVGALGVWSFLNSGPYLVSQSEIEALHYLAGLPEGKVMVWDRDCRRCGWETEFRPAALAGRRGYVSKFSHKPVVYNMTMFFARDGGEGRKILEREGVKYVYLVKYGDYTEDTHFAPADLNIEKIYETANAQIWKVK